MIKSQKISGTPEEVERDFGLDTKTLANWRSLGKGPKFRKPGKRIIYIYDDVRDWLDMFTKQTTESVAK